MDKSRRKFIKQTALGTVAVSLAPTALTAKSYQRIVGANDRLHVAIAGLGRRMGAYIDPIVQKESNVRLIYLCDVMKSQREKAASKFASYLDDQPKLENSILKVIEDKQVDVLLNATLDHWHAPATIAAVKAGKHVYVEKPCGHNPREGELLVEAAKKYDKVIQMGNQQRSAPESLEIIDEIHQGTIGSPYLATAFYTNNRGRVVNQQPASPPDGLDWNLWQGPAPRRDYTHNTWDYNWHWYGWNYGTAETGNNATHELDIARWALAVDFPTSVEVDAHKRHFVDDGWTMYDTMLATFNFENGKTIQWDGKSRNGYPTYGAGRGTIIYGTNGSVFVNRQGYQLYDRAGKLIKAKGSGGNEGGTQLGGGGNMSTRHVRNFFEAVRGKEKQHSPISEGHKSTLLCHLANIAARTGQPLSCNPTTGHVNEKEAATLWTRTYEKGWEPQL